MAGPTGSPPNTMDDAALNALLFDPFSDAFRDDPYPHYARLRREKPLYFHPAGFWVASGYAECDAVLRERRFEAVNPHEWQTELQRAAAPGATNYMQAFLRKTMLFASASDHQRFRVPLNAAFAPRVVERRRARIRALADRLIDRFPQGRPFDFVEAFSSPFPIMLITDLLGIPDEDQQKFVDWSRTISPILDALQRPEAIEAAARSMKDFRTYMLGLLERFPNGPPDGLLALMMQPGENGERLSNEELIANVGFLIAAGHGTATHLMGSGLWLLLSHPEAWASVVKDHKVLATGINEILRYESPAQMTVRAATEDRFIGGRLIPKGKRVVVLLGAANRDPEAFPDPDRFDVHRRPNAHLAFSAGAHFCLGAPLAQVEGEESFGALAQRVPDLRLTGDLEWQRTVTMRGFRRLMVQVGP